MARFRRQGRGLVDTLADETVGTPPLPSIEAIAPLWARFQPVHHKVRRPVEVPLNPQAGIDLLELHYPEPLGGAVVENAVDVDEHLRQQGRPSGRKLRLGQWRLTVEKAGQRG